MINSAVCLKFYNFVEVVRKCKCPVVAKQFEALYQSIWAWSRVYVGFCFDVYHQSPFSKCILNTFLTVTDIYIYYYVLTFCSACFASYSFNKMVRFSVLHGAMLNFKCCGTFKFQILVVTSCWNLTLPQSFDILLVTLVLTSLLSNSY